MRDTQLITLIIATIIAQEAAASIPGLPLAQAFQPTQQGVKTEPCAYLYKIGDHRRGSPLREDVWDAGQSKMIHTETQIYETTFQFSTLSTQIPASLGQFTASDLLNQIAYILQSDATIAALQAQGVGIMKIGDVRNPYFTDDRDRFEASPSFDVIFTHKQIVSTLTDVLQSVEFDIVPV